MRVQVDGYVRHVDFAHPCTAAGEGSGGQELRINNKIFKVFRFEDFKIEE